MDQNVIFGFSRLKAYLGAIGHMPGGVEALSWLVPQFPADFPSAILIVRHMAADATGDIRVKTLVEKGVILVTKGARENRSRPSVDPLFLSAVVAYGSGAVGVLLTGYLDDGTSGMMAIRRCGGTCIVQDPKDEANPDMPQCALNNLKIDHCVPMSHIGAKSAKRHVIPDDIVIEAEIAKRVLSDLGAVETLGDQVPFNGPDCGGVLWKMVKGNMVRYRCHTGHAISRASAP